MNLGKEFTVWFEGYDKLDMKKTNNLCYQLLIFKGNGLWQIGSGGVNWLYILVNRLCMLKVLIIFMNECDFFPKELTVYVTWKWSPNGMNYVRWWGKKIKYMPAKSASNYKNGLYLQK